MDNMPDLPRTLKLALLGSTPQAIAFIRRSAELGHEVLTAYDAGSDKVAIREAVPTIRYRDDWEDLLGAREIDALIVAGPTLPEDVPADQRERRDDQLRKLIQAGVPLVVIPPVCEAIVGFELEMIRRDVKGLIVPALLCWKHPALERVFGEWCCKPPGSIGEIETVIVDRYLPLRTRSEVMAAFAQDTEELVSFVIGPFTRISASGGTSNGESKPSLANLAVYIEGVIPARWSVAAPDEFVGAKMTLVGSSGRVTLTMPVSGSWKVIAPGVNCDYEYFDGVAAVLDVLQTSLSEPTFPQEPSWLDACRATEAMEAIDRSLARNRAIDLHNEEHSEESSFKGIMAASGCLMLMATLAAFSCAGALAVFFPPGKAAGDDPNRYGQFHSYWTWLQICLIVPLAVFLLAQLLSFGLSRHLRTKQSAAANPAKIAD
jgi:hypothetical protein